MDDLRTLLEESVEHEHPNTHFVEGVKRTARIRQRRRRVGSALVALTIGALATSLVVRAFDDRSIGQVPGGNRTGSLDPTTLEPAWTSVVPEANAQFPGPVFTRSSIIVPTITGAVGYTRTCADPCPPSWTFTAGRSESSRSPFPFIEIAAGDGMVAVALEGELAVVSEWCRDDGGSCEPLWVATPEPGTNGYRAPVIHDGVVRVVNSESEMPTHHVFLAGFRLDCRNDGGECDPAWIGDMGIGTSFEPSVAINGVFYKQVGSQMLGYTSDCARSGRQCDPDFQIQSRSSENDGSGDLYGPLARDGVLIVTAGTGELLAYPEHCGTICDPLWIGAASDFIDSSAMLAGDQVVVGVGGAVTSFPVGCAPEGDACQPAWSADLGGPVSLVYADDQVVVATTRAGDSTKLALLPASCPDPCEPTWAIEFDTQISAVAGDGRSLFVATGRSVSAYPLACRRDCEPVWSGKVASDVQWMSVDGRGLIAAGSTRDGFGELALTAFRSMRSN